MKPVARYGSVFRSRMNDQSALSRGASKKFIKSAIEMIFGDFAAFTTSSIFKFIIIGYSITNKKKGISGFNLLTSG